jgi:cobalt/nickel transport system ATP-binding protein
LDEPSAGLDPRSVSWLIDFIHSQTTVVLATHDLGLAETVADRIYVLDENHRIVAEGPTREVLSNHDLLVQVNLTI